ATAASPACPTCDGMTCWSWRQPAPRGWAEGGRRARGNGRGTRAGWRPWAETGTATLAHETFSLCFRVVFVTLPGVLPARVDAAYGACTLGLRHRPRSAAEPTRGPPGRPGHPRPSPPNP